MTLTNADGEALLATLGLSGTGGGVAAALPLAQAYMSGSIEGRPAEWQVAVAQVVVGGGLGARFAGVGSAPLRRALMLSLIYGVAILCIRTEGRGFTPLHPRRRVWVYTPTPVAKSGGFTPPHPRGIFVPMGKKI